MNATTTSPPPCRPRPEDESSGPTPEVERENREWVCKQYKEKPALIAKTWATIDPDREWRAMHAHKFHTPEEAFFHAVWEYTRSSRVGG